MKRKGIVVLLGFVVIVSGWWFTSRDSSSQPSEGVLDVWATWGDEAGQLQALFDQFSQLSGVAVRVTTRVRSKGLLEALVGPEPPDMVILSSSALVGGYAAHGLVEPLDRWIRATGIDPADMYPAPLEQCRGLDGAILCLPWGCDLDALFWNKDLFAAAGLDPEHPPRTMEEVVEYAQRLTVRDEEGNLSQVGFIPDFPGPQTGLYASRFGGAFYRDAGAELAVNSQPVIDALNWQKQVYNLYAPEELEDFVSSFTPYWTSHHAMYGGRRLDCRQCHRSLPLQEKKMPNAGFQQGRIAMIVDGQWQVGGQDLSHEGPGVNYGVTPFPAPSAYAERANTALVEGPVVVIPAGAQDKEAAANLLAWMTAPEILAEAAYANSMLPTSRAAARDPRFQQVPNFEMFVDLLVHPNARHVVTTPINPELDEALGQVEEKFLRQGGDLARLLGEVQAEFADDWKAAYHDEP